MNEEDLEKTGLFSIIRDEEDLDIGEQLEEIEDRLDYLDITSDKKEELEKLVSKIRKEDDEPTKEYLFSELIDELDK